MFDLETLRADPQAVYGETYYICEWAALFRRGLA